MRGTLEALCVCVSLSSLCPWVHVSAYGWNSWSAPLQSSVGDWTARAMSSLFCSGSFSRFSEQSTAVDRDVLDPLHLSYTIIQRHNNRQEISQQHSLMHIQTSRASRGHPDQFRALVKLLVQITGDSHNALQPRADLCRNNRYNFSLTVFKVHIESF